MSQVNPESTPVSPYAGFTPLSPSDEKTWAALIQLGGIFIGVVAPLVGYFLFRFRGPFIKEHTIAALNWQISLVIYYFVGYVLSIIGIGVLIVLAAAVLQITFGIIAAVRANRGQLYTYPLAIKFVTN